MRITKNYFVYSTLLVAASLSATASAATESLVFGMNQPTSGTISYTGGSNPLMGANISVDNIIGLNTSSNANVRSQCMSCTLNFSSGSFGGITTPGGVKTWNFTNGGSITVMGGVDLGSNSTVDIPLSTTLLSGVFSSASVTQETNGNFGLRIAQGSFSDSKDATLLAFYGLPIGVSYDGDLNIDFTAKKLQGNSDSNAFGSSSIREGTIANSPVPVPLPAAAWLMLSALGGFLGFARRAT